MRLRASRRGSIVPLLAVSIVALLALVALAIDIGLLAVARNNCQNAADSAAMAGVRVLNGDASNNNNYSAAAPAAQAATAANKVLGTSLTTGAATVEVGYYAYDSSAQKFQATFNGTKPASESWSAVRATIAASTPTAFAKVMGLGSMNAGATATAVHRPRDVSVVLDFSGSMKFSTEIHYPSSGDITGSLNPDDAIPRFGHWSSSSYQTAHKRTTTYVDSGGEAHAPSNLTVETANGPPVVRDFLYRDSSNALQNAFHRPTSPYNPNPFVCPAPSDWDVQSDTTATYAGDKWPRFNKSFTTGSYAATVQEYLFGNNTTQSNTHSRSTTTGGGTGQFDPANPDAPTNQEGYGPDFKGYVLGPGYYGKSFYVWPPDPRWHLTNTNRQFDWRKKFFYDYNTTTPLGGATSGGDNRVDNTKLFDSSGYWRQAGASSSYSINYDAIVAWIKSGPQVLPPNLRAGRVLYYSAIPDTIPATGGTDDQRFWRAYINYVLGAGSSTEQRQTLYGRHSSAWGTMRVTAKSSLSSTAATRPYMHYNDNPIRPRLHTWFGPLSMICFLTENNASGYDRNWWPGTCHEAQCWQLKAGVNSALSDIQKNHPNDWVAMMYFSSLDSYATPRVPLGRDYAKLKNCLFFPFTTLANLSDSTYEVRPYNSSFSDAAAGNVPNANGGTCPELGFKVAYNQLSGRSGYNGRRGATKMVIFETDGVPNTQTTGTSTNLTLGSPAPYNSYFASVATGSYIANNDPGVVQRAKDVVQIICNLDSHPTLPGYSTARSKARVHAIAFGELFETTSSRKTDALQFLLDVQKIGGTSSSSTTQIEDYKIITGDYETRIEKMRQAFERIMQSGVQVSLIK
ncbi:MAG: hypothetical protein K2W96_18840 [Gemmataceae bacterium]|nr:hypothetical protein [Gemmataceae bacterium]